MSCLSLSTGTLPDLIQVNLWHIAAGPSGNLHELVPRESVTEGGQRTQWDLLTTRCVPDKVPSSSRP